MLKLNTRQFNTRGLNSMFGHAYSPCENHDMLLGQNSSSKSPLPEEDLPGRVL